MSSYEQALNKRLRDSSETLALYGPVGADTGDERRLDYPWSSLYVNEHLLNDLVSESYGKPKLTSEDRERIAYAKAVQDAWRWEVPKPHSIPIDAASIPRTATEYAPNAVTDDELQPENIEKHIAAFQIDATHRPELERLLLAYAVKHFSKYAQAAAQKADTLDSMDFLLGFVACVCEQIAKGNYTSIGKLAHWLARQWKYSRVQLLNELRLNKVQTLNIYTDEIEDESELPAGDLFIDDVTAEQYARLDKKAGQSSASTQIQQLLNGLDDPTSPYSKMGKTAKEAVRLLAAGLDRKTAAKQLGMTEGNLRRIQREVLRPIASECSGA